MANIIITSARNILLVDWNSAAKQWAKEPWHKSSTYFYLQNEEAFVEVRAANGTTAALSFDGSSNTLQVDTVDGIEPTSNRDLYDKLIALIA